MIINRRTYYLYPGKFNEALALLKEIRELTKQHLSKDFRILTAIYGPFGTIVMEFEYENTHEQDKFSERWYPLLFERGLVEKWFSFVQSGTNELWQDNR